MAGGTGQREAESSPSGHPMSTTSQPQLHIRLLGGIGVRVGDGAGVEVKSRASALLLARLACAPNQVQRREALIDALFPDDFPEAGRTKLRQCLYVLRQELEPLGVATEAFLHAERETIRLLPGAVSTDIGELSAAFERARRAGSERERVEQLRAAAVLCEGEFLPGHFDDWTLGERERLREQQAGVLCELAVALAGAGDAGEAIDRARQAVGIDRLREESHRALMRAFAAAGRPGDAERQYRDLERLMREELEVGPSAATQQLREEIRSGALGSTPSPTPPAASPAKPPERGVRRPRIPQPVNRFYGRTEELARVERWLAGDAGPGAAPDPLVTLTGPGGAGKTRLALEIAHRLDNWFEGAVWFVPLEGAVDAAGFLNALVDALGVCRSPDGSPEDVSGSDGPRSWCWTISSSSSRPRHWRFRTSAPGFPASHAWSPPGSG
jgi:DNA-binding SARP family transcriptional activator